MGLGDKGDVFIDVGIRGRGVDVDALRQSDVRRYCSCNLPAILESQTAFGYELGFASGVGGVIEFKIHFLDGEMVGEFLDGFEGLIDGGDGNVVQWFGARCNNKA